MDFPERLAIFVTVLRSVIQNPLAPKPVEAPHADPYENNAGQFEVSFFDS